MLLATALLIAIVALMQTQPSPAPADAHDEGHHAHANFAVYVNGEQFNFTREKYMSTIDAPSNPYFHLHDLDGGALHQHYENLTIGYFFKTIGMEFNSSCLTLDNGTAYCTNPTSSLRMFVQPTGRQWMGNAQFGNYVFSDLDRILIVYGNDTSEAITAMRSSVPDNACIYSEKCPERGSPPNESASCASGSSYCG